MLDSVIPFVSAVIIIGVLIFLIMYRYYDLLPVFYECSLIDRISVCIAPQTSCHLYDLI